MQVETTLIDGAVHPVVAVRDPDQGVRREARGMSDAISTTYCDTCRDLWADEIKPGQTFGGALAEGWGGWYPAATGPGLFGEPRDTPLRIFCPTCFEEQQRGTRTGGLDE
jgi:hypothetical protein